MATLEATGIYQFITNNHALFRLWRKENLLNHPKLAKYYEHDCLQNVLLLFISLSTALIVKNSHFLAVIYFLFVEKRPRLNLKSFQYQNLVLVKRSNSQREISYQVRQILVIFAN